jgi:tetratricopeptide (TPR) repeat protein
MLSEWDWSSAEREFQRALDMKPGYATAHQWYAALLTARSRHDAALSEIRQARALDPASKIIQASVGAPTLYFAHRYPEAAAALTEAAEMDPAFRWTQNALVLVYVQQEKLQEAEAAVAREEALTPGHVTETRAYVEAVRGNRAAARALLPALEKAARERRSGAYDVAWIHAALRDPAAAVRWLDEATRNREAMLVFAAVDPAFLDLHTHPGFRALLERLGLGASLRGAPRVIGSRP